MRSPEVLQRFGLHLMPPADAEREPGFAAVIARHTRLGMRLAAWLGLLGIGLFAALQVIEGKRPALFYGADPDAVVVILDEIVILVLCVGLLVASRRPAWVERLGRTLLGAVLVIAGAAIAADDAARADYSFTAAWLGLVLLVGVSSVPFRPRQAFVIWAILGLFALTLALAFPGVSGSEGPSRPVAYFLLTGFILTGISALLYSGRYRQYHALREAEQLREQLAEQERQRIADDLHDDLGSKVSAFALRLALAAERAPDRQTQRELQALAGQTRGLVDELRDTIWLVDAQHDALGALVERIRSAAADLLPDRVVISADPLPVSILLSPATRRAVYLATREALNNAAKHARPNRVSVHLSLDAHEFVVAIQDDGVGFDVAHARRGHGLGSLDRRLRSAGGTCAVESRPGYGTRVTLCVPLGESAPAAYSGDSSRGQAGVPELSAL